MGLIGPISPISPIGPIPIMPRERARPAALSRSRRGFTDPTHTVTLPPPQPCTVPPSPRPLPGPPGTGFALPPSPPLPHPFWRAHSMCGYLIDMDGVIYRGTTLIPGADRFIHELRGLDVPFRFLTNNSQRTRR